MDRREATRTVVDAHRAAGSFFTVGGVTSFARSEGRGEPVVLMHGLPSSSFLYRKVIRELATRGYRAVAFDLPGLGLADRPPGFDYRLTGLGAFSAAAADALGLDRFHLVVHDAGGPVGFEMAARVPDRIRSLTILNTVVELGSTPFPGEVYARFSRRIGGRIVSPSVWRWMMLRVGIEDRSSVSDAEIDAYRVLALGSDEGAGYLNIMRGLRAGHERRRYGAVVDTRRVPYPVRVAWGGRDPILRVRRFAWPVLAATHLSSMTVLPAKHFLQEDQAPAVAEIVAQNAARA